MSIDLQPYAGLDPQTVMHALALAGLEADGRMLQLNSYENRVWQAHLMDGRVVVAKFYRPGRWTDEQILEEHDFAHELSAADLPVVAPFGLTAARDAGGLSLQGAQRTLATLIAEEGEEARNEFRFAVYDRRAGRAPELEQDETLSWLGRLIGRMHAVGSRGGFRHRRSLDVDTLGRRPRQRLIDAGTVHAVTGGAWMDASARALDQIEAIFESIQDLRTLRLHGDCHPGNVLWRETGACAGPNMVDLDDCGTGPAMQDLWMLLPGQAHGATAATRQLLNGYRSFMDFDERELRLIEPLRTLRMIHHSAWLAERWSDPAFPIGFPWFASASYWDQQAHELQEQIDQLALI